MHGGRPDITVVDYLIPPVRCGPHHTDFKRVTRRPIIHNFAEAARLLLRLLRRRDALQHRADRRQMRDAGLPAPVVGGDGYDTPDLISVAGAASNNVY